MKTNKIYILFLLSFLTGVSQVKDTTKLDTFRSNTRSTSSKKSFPKDKFLKKTPLKSNLKVGLVLSGGGAKGLAHIGALKAIEEAGVQINYIAGTSMGAIVGALYASGYTADELKTIFKKVDFETLMSDDFERKNKSFFERNNDDRHAVTLPFNNLKLSFPSALSKGQNVYNLYVRLLNHVSHISDFSKLPIPFFCIATNLENGKQKILNKGYLPNAIAASSAVPSLFEPVHLDEKLLIDGGISNNYPIHELLKKDIHVTIGVDVQDSLRKKENLKSIMDIMTQISNFTIQNQMEQHKVESTTIYIKPNITKYNIISFDKAPEIYNEGYLATKKYLEQLKEIAKQQVQKPIQKINKDLLDEYTFKKIQILGNKNYTKAYILGKLKLKENTATSYKKIEKGITALAATNNFYKINFKIEANNTLVIGLKENNNRTNLKLGLHFDDLYKGNALINLTHKQLITNNDIASFDLILGEKMRYNFEYYIDKGFFWSIGVKSSFNAFEKKVGFQIFDNNSLTTNIIDLNASELINQFYLETIFKTEFTLALGAQHQQIEFYYETPANNIFLEDNEFFSVFADLQYDTLDDIYYPTKGLYFDMDFKTYLITSNNDNFEEFSVINLKMGGVKTFLKKLHTSVFIESGIRIGNNTSPTFDFVLGGFGNNFILNHKAFYGYDFLSIAGDGYLKGTIDVNYLIKKNHHLIASANFANIDDGLYKDADWLSLPSYSGYALGYGAKTFLGPMQIKSTWSPEVKEVYWFISLGYWF